MRSAKARKAGISPDSSESKIEQLLAPKAVMTPAQDRRARFLKFARGAFVFRGETSDFTAITEFLTLLDKEQKYVYSDLIALVERFAPSSSSAKEVVTRRGLSIFVTIAEIHRRITLLNLVETFEAEQAKVTNAFEVLDKRKEVLIKACDSKEIDHAGMSSDIDRLIQDLVTNRDLITVRSSNPLALTTAFAANLHSIEVVQSHISPQKSWINSEPYWDGLANLAADTYAQWDRISTPQLAARIASIEKPGIEDKKLITKYEQSITVLRELKNRVHASYQASLRRLHIPRDESDGKKEPSEAEMKLKQDVVKFSQDADRESKNLLSATLELSKTASVLACRNYLTALSSSLDIKKFAENYIYRIEEKRTQLSIKGTGLAKAVVNIISDHDDKRSLQDDIATANSKLNDAIEKAEAIKNKVTEVQQAQFDLLLNMIAELFLEQNLRFLNNQVTIRSCTTVNGVQVPQGFKEIYDVLNNHRLSRFDRLNQIIAIANRKNAETSCCVSFFRKATTSVAYQTIARLNVLANDINNFTNLDNIATRIHTFKTALVGIADSQQRHFVFTEEASLSLSPKS
ncbi:MAG: hypothetical protein ACYCQI_02070 [Gammaproteobacteria bacterium]